MDIVKTVVITQKELEAFETVSDILYSLRCERYEWENTNVLIDEIVHCREYSYCDELDSEVIVLKTEE